MLKRLLSLPTLVPTVLEDEEENTFQKEVHALCVDGNLPTPLNDEDNEVDCLEWWDKISGQYSVMFKVVCAILSIFHGPKVESTLSVMNNVIDKEFRENEYGNIWSYPGNQVCSETSKNL